MCQDIDKHNAIRLVMQTTKTRTNKCKAWFVFKNDNLFSYFYQKYVAAQLSELWINLKSIGR